MKEKLNKGFKISYIINSCIFLIVIFLLVNMFMKNSGNLIEDLAVGFVYVGLYLLNFLVSIILFVITTILGVKNFKKVKKEDTKKKITLMMSLLGLAHFAILLFTIITIILA